MMAAKFDSEKFLHTLTHRPGVYRMLDDERTVLYVGKARDLKKRVASYFGKKAFHPKTQALMAITAEVDVTVTGTEKEALLLEYNLIKAHQPRFNVLLRDGKGYPYIRVTMSHDFPRFEFHRGSRETEDRYFGPYPGAGSVRQTLAHLQKLFNVRQCDDSFFSNRSRPCLQYQIKRCSAPCVGFIDHEKYHRDVKNAVRFLSGHNGAIIGDLAARMDDASDKLDFEGAAQYRDQIAAIKDLQARQAVAGIRTRDADGLAIFEQQGRFCVAVIMIRGGKMLGGRTYFPRTAAHTETSEVLSAFMVQHYYQQTPPPEILASAQIDNRELLEGVLSEWAGYKVSVRWNVRGHRRRWLEMGMANARQGMATHLATASSLRAQLDSLTDLLQLDDVPERIECFDISHTSGMETVASCVVFGPEGAIKSAYRRFNIKGVAAGDDYAAIAQVVERRYTRIKKGEAPMPDLILIDGGRGQQQKAREALLALQLGDIDIVGVAKGMGRKPGREKIFGRDAGPPMLPPADSPALHLIQQIRDEAHRFAITGHRQRRGKSQNTSVLESIPGLGPARRKALLREFGGLQGVKRAGIDDLIAVRGINHGLAERIYNHFHGGVI
jgi:excinuclease ABC subunit C